MSGQGQLTYGDPSRMIAGMSRPNAIKYDESSYNSEASAAMRMGIWVKRGTQVAGPPTNASPALLLTGLTDKAFGVTAYRSWRDRLLEEDDTTGGYKPNVDLPVRLFGPVAVRVEGNIVPGDRPHVRVVSGAGGTMLGVCRASAVAGETIDCSNQGEFISTDDQGISSAGTQERFAWLFMNAFGDALIQGDEIAAASIPVSKLSSFKSTEQTGTGSAQNVAHGLGAVPGLVIVYPTDTSPATVGVYTMVEGAHDATNVIVTVTLSKKFKVVAFA